MDYIFYLTLFLIPWLALSPWQTVAGIPGGFIFVCLVAVCTLFTAVRANGLLTIDNLKKTPLMGALVLFLAANVLSLLRILVLEGTGGLWSNNLKEIGYLFFAVVFYWTMHHFIDNEEKLIAIIRLMIASSVLACLYGIGRLVLFMFHSPFGLAQPWTVPRLLAPAGESQVIGGFIIAFLPLVIAVLLYKAPSFNRGLIFVGVFILLLGLIMTFSAGAWAGFAGALLLLFAFVPFYDFRQLTAVFLTFVLVISVVVLIDKTIYPGYLNGFGSVTQKFTGITGASVSGYAKDSVNVTGSANVTDSGRGKASGVTDPGSPRFNPSAFSGVERSWFRAALVKMFRSSPVFGVGTGNFEKLYNKYRPAEAPAPPYTPKPHNQYLEILAETGIVGLLSFLSIIGALFSSVIQSWSGLSGKTRKLLLGLAASLAAVGIHGYSFGILVHIQVWLLAALISAVITVSGRKPSLRYWREDRL
ncbi:MAG TPA: O-antigen ligase family protein [Desulfobacteria bacterium]|nr:O-antigen ligase family protein [Desulfobacteria bacterium]